MKFKFLFLLLSIPLSTPAQIATDGTLGQTLNLPGPDYQIGADLGQQHGGNLFHSFQDFNLQSFETATFVGPNHIQNVISRVTGGHPSYIDGLIRSTIPNAELFFLNPAGIIFGEHAQLDVLSGFHASTADYLRLGETGRFDASIPANSLLTIAPPMAFGFLNAPVEIKLQGSQLTVTSKTDFSFIGGNLTLDHTRLLASSGRINLVSVASQGEVTAKIDHLEARIPDTSSFAVLGQIAMRDSHVETTGSPSGGISISGRQLIMENSLIYAHNLGKNDGKEINIELSDWMRMNSNLDKVQSHQHTNDRIEAKTSFGITSDTFGIGKAGRIAISVPRLEIHQNTIDASTKGEGKGGNIDIQTQQMYLGEGAAIFNNVYDTGDGGQININSTQRLELSDQRIFLTAEEINENQATVIQTNTFAQGNSGHIKINTSYFELSGSPIHSNGQGHGGQVEINADSLGTGNAGNISIKANKIHLSQGAITSTAVQAVGGHIIIALPHLLNLQNSQITTSVQGGIGDGGNITIETPTFVVMNNGQIIAQADAGHGGNIRIAAERFIKSDESLVSASSRLGIDGQVKIDSPNENITEGMLSLSSEMVDVSRMMKKSCDAMTYQERENRSKFIVHPIAGNPASPYDLQPSRLPQTTSTKQRQQSNRKITTHQPRPIIATTCKPSPAQIKTLKNRVIPEQLF